MINKAHLFACSVLGTTLCCVPAFAQTAAPPPTASRPAAESATQDSSDNQTIDAVVVVGTRIVREGYQAPTPMSVISPEQLLTSANANVAQTITTLPAFSGSVNTRSSVASGSTATAGVNSLNLRSLGAARTLVLLDGHRFPPVTASGIVDVNTLPQGLISGVDVVTGGASAVYGSDAVAGVVNFVLDKNFVGLKGEISGGKTNYGDGENYKVSLSGGLKFAGGRGRVLVAGEQSQDDGIRDGSDRDWPRLGVQQMVNPTYTATNGQPQRLILPNVGYYTASQGGVISGGPLATTAFGPGGAPYQLNLGDILSDPYMRGGDWASNDIRRPSWIAPKESRQTGFGRVSYDLTNDINVYAQAAYIRTKTGAPLAYVYMPGTAGPLINITNPFIPDAVRTRMVAAGLSSIRVGTLNRDLGVTYQNSERTATVLSAGANGRFDLFNKPWVWDLYAQTGQSKTHLETPNNISRANYALAVDAVRDPATNAIVCRSTLTNPANGCSPYNPMGLGVNDPSGPGSAFVHSGSFQDGKVTQDVYAATLTGEPLSNWAGPISLALSLEHRKDSATATVDARSLTQDHIYANYTPIDGSTSVTEAAAETVIPLLNKQWGIDNWDLNAAVRYTSYSLAGEVATWKIGTTFSPIADLKIRATRSRDIRAPNIQELFSPPNTLRSSLFDPFTNTTPAFSQSTVGNRNLKPEKADTIGVGVVYQPSFIPGLSGSVDYWDIDIRDAISSVTPANVLLLCFDGSRPDLCANITRVNGVLTEVVSQVINFANQHVRGIDYEASYRLPLNRFGDHVPGELSFHGNATRYLKDYIDSRVAPPQDYVGENSLGNPPTWRYSGTVAYKLDTLNVSLTARGFSGGTQFANYIECSSACPTSTTAHPTVNDNHMAGRTYLDAAISYGFEAQGHPVTAFFNVRNLTNKDPDPSVAGVNFTNGANSLLYDVEGRVYRAGLRFSF